MEESVTMATGSDKILPPAVEEIAESETAAKMPLNKKDNFFMVRLKRTPPILMSEALLQSKDTNVVRATLTNNANTQYYGEVFVTPLPDAFDRLLNTHVQNSRTCGSLDCATCDRWGPRQSHSR